MQTLKDGHLITQFDQIPGDGQSGRSGTDNGDLLPVGRRRFRKGNLPGCPFVIGGKAFQPPDGHRIAFFAENADLLALFLLRADPAADGWQAVRFLQDMRRLDKVSIGNGLDELRNAHFHRATGDTAGLFALDAAFGFQNGRFLGISQRDFLKIRYPDPGILLGHLLPGNLLFLFLFDFSFHSTRTCVFHKLCLPDRSTSAGGSSANQNPPDGRRTRGHPHR